MNPLTDPIVPNHTLHSPSPGRRRLRLRCRRSPVVRLRLLRRRPQLQSWRRVRLVRQLVRLHRRRVRTDRVGSDEPQSALESIRVHQDRARQLARSRQQDQRRSEVQGARIGPGPAIERPLRGRCGAKTNTIKTISQPTPPAHPTLYHDATSEHRLEMACGMRGRNRVWRVLPRGSQRTDVVCTQYP